MFMNPNPYIFPFSPFTLISCASIVYEVNLIVGTSNSTNKYEY